LKGKFSLEACPTIVYNKERQSNNTKNNMCAIILVLLTEKTAVK
jgi:hypothetical protein